MTDNIYSTSECDIQCYSTSEYKCVYQLYNWHCDKMLEIIHLMEDWFGVMVSEVSAHCLLAPMPLGLSREKHPGMGHVGTQSCSLYGSQGAREMGCRVCVWPWFQYFPAVSASGFHAVSSLYFCFDLLNPWCAQSPKTSIQFTLFRCLHKTPRKSHFYFILQVKDTILRKGK